MRKEVKSIMVSDVHLGSVFSQAKHLNDFLSSYKCEYLFILGDFFDGWKLKKGFYWTDEKTFVIRRILSMIKKDGTKVIYLTGNHDEFLRDFPIETFGSIHVCDEYIYESFGRRILLLHGDLFDNLCNSIGLLYHVGDKLYTIALHINRITNYIRRKFGFKYYPISSILKRKVKGAVNFINNFEFAVAKYCKKKGCSDVIVGHIHHAELNKKLHGINYHNTGDFVESCTAIIETLDGELQLLKVFQES
jgi:UDP-2,3-diacylglucosamine pyrophosphatase LpxH